MENSKKYFIVLEKRKFDYMPINITLLDISCGKNYSNIIDIDYFTKSFSKNDIIDSIKKANLVTEDYLNGELCVVELEDNNTKYLHKYPCITNDFINGFDLTTFIYNNIKDRNIMNSIKNKFISLNIDKNIVNNLQLFINETNVKETVKLFINLPYLENRELCIYIIENFYKKQRELELLKKKIA